MNFRGCFVNVLKFSANVSYVRVCMDFHINFYQKNLGGMVDQCSVKPLSQTAWICITTHHLAV